MNSGRNGITSVKPVKPTKEAAVTAHRLRRQVGDTRAPGPDQNRIFTSFEAATWMLSTNRI